MPKLKHEGRETLRREEFDMIIRDCDKVAKPARLRCILSITWLFGKRISEIMKLKREDLWFSNGFLVIRFDVGKKRHKEVVKKTYIKQIMESNEYVQKYVKPYIETIRAGYIFPSYSNRSCERVIMGSKVYEYEREGGHLSASRVRQQLLQINDKVWPHLIRHSLATRMAEKGVGVPQLMAWFDWDSANVAMHYVEGTPQMTEELSRREF